MKKILLVALIASIGISSFANAEGRKGGRGYGGYRGGYEHHGGNGMGWIAPLAIGGLIGYELSRQPTVIYQQPPVVYQQAPMINVQPNQPIYQYQNIYDNNCLCYRQVLVQIN